MRLQCGHDTEINLSDAAGRYKTWKVAQPRHISTELKGFCTDGRDILVQEHRA